MLHAAIYRARAGSVIVVESGDLDYALAGGNVCGVAQRHGIAGFVLDGLVRDIGEIRGMGFPVFARGVIPKPGAKAAVAPLGVPVRCGGVVVNDGDLVVADEDGVVVVPHATGDALLRAARDKAAKEAAQSLEDWETDHRARIDKLLAEHG
jgi:4-hydroxy-4-methyl-2-oxoglutarate aldolase